MCETSSRCCFRPPSPYCQAETPAEEELDRRQLPAPATRHHHAAQGITTQQEFKIALLNKWQALNELLEEETSTEKGQAIRESFTSTCKEVLGPKKEHYKEWISVETRKKIRESKKAEINNSRTRAGKVGSYGEYPHASKKIKESIKADKKGIHKNAGNRNRRGVSPRKSAGTVHHHQEAVWKVRETRETSKRQKRKAYP